MIEMWRERNPSGPRDPAHRDQSRSPCYILSAPSMTSPRQQTKKAIMLDLDRFVSAQTFTIIDGKPVVQPPEDEPRPQYALDNERANRRRVIKPLSEAAC